ncbi:hypothetical protein [uncultured Aquimarina sp.]|uniref:hypothetical protein n=1 Tax=uncultured Aquimarina sp. TaxID=575652 RepID=UPI002629CBC5|nr:hypothetical protein [uncultured Aquimarina sp.]
MRINIEKKIKDWNTTKDKYELLIEEYNNKYWNDFNENLESAQKLYYASLIGLDVFKDDEKLNDLLKRLSRLYEDSTDKTFPTISTLPTINGVRGANIISIKALKFKKPEMLNEIHKIALNQLVVTYSLLLENFIGSTIQDHLERFPKALKSQKSTFKDDELIESLLEGNTLQTIIGRKVNDIMYGSIQDWFKHLSKIGFDITLDENLVEMYLVRNCIIHNGNRVSEKLVSQFGNKFHLNDKIVLTDQELTKYFKSLRDIIRLIRHNILEKQLKTNSM